MRRGAVLGLVLIAFGSARYGHAQSPDTDTLMKDGLALRRQRRDAEALADFRKVYAIRATPRALAQIALAEQALGLWVDAEAHLRSALQATDDGWIEPHRQVLAAGLADIQSHLGKLEVDADVPGAELWVNGKRAASLPVPQALRVEAGSVVIEVRAAGYAPARRHTSVEAGESAHETIHLVPLVAQNPSLEAGATPQPRTPPVFRALSGLEPRAHVVAPDFLPDRPMRAASFVWFGAAAVGLAAGAYFGVRTLVKQRERDTGNHCTSTQCDAIGFQLDGQAHSLADRSTAWFAFGIVAAGAGAGLFWISRAKTPPGKTEGVRWGLDVDLRGGHAVLGGVW
jgi:PEGA domain